MKKKNITKKELGETISRQIQQYYHMEDRFDELKNKLTFLSPEESEKLREQMRKQKYYSFQKKRFVPVAILTSLLLVGGTIGLTSMVNQKRIDRNNLNLYEVAFNDAKTYFFKYYKNYQCQSNVYVEINEKTIIHTYKLSNNYDKLCAFQIFTKDNNPNIKVDLSCNEYTKFITYSEDNQISILNDTSFLLEEGDLITGKVYINDILNRKIAMYF